MASSRVHRLKTCPTTGFARCAEWARISSLLSSDDSLPSRGAVSKMIVLIQRFDFHSDVERAWS